MSVSLKVISFHFDRIISKEYALRKIQDVSLVRQVVINEQQYKVRNISYCSTMSYVSNISRYFISSPEPKAHR